MEITIFGYAQFLFIFRLNHTFATLKQRYEKSYNSILRRGLVDAINGSQRTGQYSGETNKW